MLKRKSVLGIVLSLMLLLSLELVACENDDTNTDLSRAGSETANSTAIKPEIKTVTPGVITVGSSCDYPPFIEMKGDKAVGYEQELLEAIAKEMGYELEYLPPMTFDSILAALASNSKMDVGCSSFTINEERKELVYFTTPYFDSNQAVVALVDSPYASAMDFNGKTVGAQSGTTGAEWVKENLKDEGTLLKEYSQAPELMAALVAGDIEGAFYDKHAAVEWLNTLYTNAHIVESIPTDEHYGIAVSKDNPELLQALNKAMKTIKEKGVFDEIFTQYFPDLTPPSLGAVDQASGVHSIP